MRAAQLLLAALLVAGFVAVAYASADRHPLYEWIAHPSKHWIYSGRADPNMKHHLTIGMPPKNKQQLESLFWDISTPGTALYRKFMTVDQVNKMTEPPKSVSGPVLAWLRSVEGVKIKTFGEIIKVEAPVKAIEELFQTRMAKFQHRDTGKYLVRHLGKTSIPAHLSESIVLVEGLHEFPGRKHTSNTVRVDIPAGAGAFPFVSQNYPPVYFQLYNIPNGTTVKSSKSTQGVFAQYAADGICQVSDLHLFDERCGIAEQNYAYNGENDTVTGGEASLDIQMMTSIAQNAPTTFFMQQAWMYTFMTDLLALGSAAPKVVSVSYSWGEDEECSDVLHDINVCKQHGWSNNQYISNVDAQFQKWGVVGNTFLTSSGDQGAPGDENVDCSEDSGLALYPQYPASSPYVVSVSATAIVGSGPAQLGPSVAANKPPCQTSQLNCTRGAHLSEVPCVLASSDFTTGGGFSRIEPQPSYQAGAVAHYLASGVPLPPSSKFNRTGRGYPDVSALGQNILTVQGGEWYTTGGTSSAAPLTAGIMTLINDWLFANGKLSIGFPNPLLYKMANTSGVNAFNLITSGNNKCTEDACCTYGYTVPSDGSWNPVTGLGTPNFGNIIKYLNANLHEL